jgi:hypothetical protein
MMPGDGKQGRINHDPVFPALNNKPTVIFRRFNVWSFKMGNDETQESCH